MDVYFIGNAPTGYTDFTEIGERRFYFRAEYLGGEMKLDRKLYKDYAWARKSEFPDYFEEPVLQYLQKMLG